MEIKLKEQDEITIMEVRGDIKFSNWHEIVHSANEVIDSGKERLIVSWENVGYMDSSAMGALITVHKLFEKLPNGKSVIFTSRKEHHFVFQQAHFHMFLDIFDDMDNAVGSFSVEKEAIKMTENGVKVIAK
jgi:anti-anti-sigma factor